jgi:acyl dehydratase
MAEGSLITDDMRALVDKESDPWYCEITRQNIRLFARAVGYTDPIYYDVDAAKAKGHRDLVAPVGFAGIPVFDPNTHSAFDDDAGSFPWVTAGLNGGTDFEYLDVLYAGDVLEARRKVTNWAERSSRMGQMVIMNQDVVYRRDGKVVAIDHGTSLLVAGEQS